MTPDESLEAQQRMQALMLADRRSKEDATPDQVLAEAEKVLAFLKAGIKVAG